MITIETLPIPLVPLKCTPLQWRIVPDKVQPETFQLCNKEEKVFCTLSFHHNNPRLLNLIACAPELEDIAEMFRDHMLGGPMEHTMLFTLVQTVLSRLKPIIEQKPIK